MKTVHVVPPSGKTRGKFVKQQNYIVQGLYVTFFVLSLCFAAAGSLAQQSNRERNQGGQGGRVKGIKEVEGGKEVKGATWKAWIRALVWALESRAIRPFRTIRAIRLKAFRHSRPRSSRMDCRSLSKWKTSLYPRLVTAGSGRRSIATPAVHATRSLQRAELPRA